MNTTAEQLFHLIEKGVSPYQVVEEAEKRLKEAGFEKLEFHTAWGLTGGKSYYMIHHGTTPVSYTHLDVYKRQREWHPMQMMILKLKNPIC